MALGFVYDVELLLTDVKTIFQTNLNDKIDFINLEKANRTPETNDDFAISRIPDRAWYFNHIPTVWSYNQFILWGIESIDIIQGQPDGAKQKVTIFIEVAVPDKGEPINESVIYKLLRYSRALQDISMKNFDRIRSYGSLQVESLSPALVSIGDKKLRISGINISATIGLR